MEKEFVVFYSPGTLFSEQTTLPIDKWNVDKAIEMSYGVKERHGSIPYGFCFITKGRTEKDLDSKEIKRSNMYFLGGKILTLKDLENQNDSNNATLISNMKGNNWNKVIENTNSWKCTLPFEKDDMLLEYEVRK